jgi:hypothetical protein
MVVTAKDIAKDAIQVDLKIEHKYKMSLLDPLR